MPIRFHCEQCGHPMEVDDHLAGMGGKCKHCGHHLVVPEHAEAVHAPDAGLALRPAEPEPASPYEHLLPGARPASPTLRPAEAEPPKTVKTISSPPDDPAWEGHRAGADPHYGVIGPEERGGRVRSPISRKVVLLQVARAVSGELRTIRNLLYVASVLFLTIALLGFLFKLKVMLHAGAVGVIFVNVSMLVVGFAYLVSLPFQEGPVYGLANLIPFYAVYYWITRWPRMKKPVLKTLGAFLPVALVGLAYGFYEEAPVIEKTLEERVPALERTFEKELDTRAPRLEKAVDGAVDGIENGGPPAAEPSAADDAGPRRRRRP
jgi:DNA-directed RNA polymerase subunit RPC12/RpoP